MAHDRDRIAKAVRTGLPDEVIAERLGCSTRTVQRVRKARGLQRNANRNPDIWGSASEWALWRMWKENLGASVAEVAQRFCRTRQAIYDGLDRLDTQQHVSGIPQRFPDHTNPAA